MSATNVSNAVMTFGFSLRTGIFNRGSLGPRTAQTIRDIGQKFGVQTRLEITDLGGGLIAGKVLRFDGSFTGSRDALDGARNAMRTHRLWA